MKKNPLLQYGNVPVFGKTIESEMHALVYRAWQRRIKGRDWFDFEWQLADRIRFV